MGDKCTYNKYENFTDDEIYILSRQAIESSLEIVMSGNYQKAAAEIHNRLLNELIAERRDRLNNVR